MESAVPPPLTSALRDVISQLDSLIRGRRVDLASLKSLGLSLLKRTLVDDELAQATDKDTLAAQGEKLFAMLRVRAKIKINLRMQRVRARNAPNNTSLLSSLSLHLSPLPFSPRASCKMRRTPPSC